MSEKFHTPERESQRIFYANIGEYLKSVRKGLKLTQEDLAWMLSISRVSVNNIETGKQRAPLHFLVSICNVLNIKYTELPLVYTGTVKTIDDLRSFKAINSFNPDCSHKAMQHIISITGDEYNICPICNYSKKIK